MTDYFIDKFAATCILSFMCAVIGWVYVMVLLRPDGLLSFWKRFVYKMYDKVFGINTPASDKYRAVLKPITDCEYCVSGWLACFFYLLLMKITLLYLIFCICLAILLAKTLTNLLKTN